MEFSLHLFVGEYTMWYGIHGYIEEQGKKDAGQTKFEII
jgi:hypothetical protein